MYVFASPPWKKLSNFNKKYICSESCAYLKGKLNFRTWGEVLSKRAYADLFANMEFSYTE